MKLKLLGLAALAMIACLAVTASAQDKPAARKVMIKEKYEAGLIIKETSKETRDTTTTFTVGGQSAEKVEQDKEDQEKTTEVRSVGDVSGKITSALVTYTKDKKSHAEQNPGDAEMSEAMESTGDLEGAEISWDWAVELKKYSSKLVKGESNDGTKKALAKKDPFNVPFIPGKEVAVGESWDVAEQALRDFFGDDETMKVKEIKASCKAEEIVTDKSGEWLKVTFVMDMKLELQNEQLKNPEVTAKINGHYMFNIGTSRCDSVELKPEMSFSGEAPGRGGEKIPFTVKMTGTNNMTLTYSKAEKKEGGK